MPYRKTLTKVRVVLRDKVMEYDSLKEAQESFPGQLDIYRGSKTFTSALDDIDALRFETWEIHNAFSED